VVGSVFDPVAAEYAAGRPSYPDSVFAAIERHAGPLAGATVIEGGAGTGIASRQLRARGARVVAVDLSEAMLRQGQVPAAGPAAIADGARLPLRDGCAALVAYAQAWHWLDAAAASAEVARVLRPGGAWAAWWSYPRADGEAWFDRYQDLIEAACPVYRRSRRDVDWGATLDAAGGFAAPVRFVRPWRRPATVEGWLTDEQSHSYVAGLDPPARDALVAELRALLDEAFPDGRMAVAYETWLWIARRTG
jgi:SAM-dependent methyltransferase